MYLETFKQFMTNLDSMFKSRDITLPTKVRLVKAMVFPVVMYERESWTVKNAESQRLDAFELWCWRRLLRVPWTARRYNQSILKEISPGLSLEGMMLKLKLQYFGHLMRSVDSLERTLSCWEGLGAGGKQDERGEWGQWKIWLKAQLSENEDHGLWCHHLMGNRWEKFQTLFFGAPKSLQIVTAAMKLKDAYSLEEKLWPT